jgi:pseudouridine-5'-phosphate glycosidase
MSVMPDTMRIAPEVAAAFAAGRAIVALESTIVTHGMPYPDNVATARAVAEEVRDAGAVPAAIAVIDGVARIGLDDASLDRLGQGGAAKASRRDLAMVMASGGSAGTTVAATMFLAARAGIAVFATGGIGGVHRGAEDSLDISADLLELGASPVCVVCAGCKSILDIGRTLEVLETQGVPVIGYRTDRFPAFYARDSGFPLEHRADTPDAIAAVIAMQHALGVPGGLLIGNPIPPEHALDAAEIDTTIARAVADAAAAGITGKAVTPYLLGRIVALSGGRSLATNIALIRDNARLAAAIAVALARRQRG